MKYILFNLNPVSFSLTKEVRPAVIHLNHILEACSTSIRKPSNLTELSVLCFSLVPPGTS